MLQITKFYPIIKNSSTPELAKLRAACRYFCFALYRFSVKNSRYADVQIYLFLLISALWEQYGPTLSKKGGLSKKRLNTTGLDYMKKFISVLLNESKTVDLQILRKM